jgi:glycosyltransferase involved in cell wall biosynthesis
VTRRGPPRPIRLAILDDNPFVSTAEGTVHPVDATFHRFAAAVVAAGPFEPARYLVPVREADPTAGPPRLGPVDGERLHVTPTRPNAGAADYLAHLPQMTRSNWPVLRDAASWADVMWIKVPASNALAAAIACRLDRVPRFAWVAGSTLSVVRSQRRSALDGLAAQVAGILYDGVTALLERTGPTIRLDADLFTSVVTAAEVAAAPAAPRDRMTTKPWRLVWSGRVAGEKGLDDLLTAVAHLAREDLPVELTIVGDGPERPALERLAATHGVGERIRWAGYIGERERYMATLRDADLFVLPSRSEGVPKVLLEAMAAGVPIVATDVGNVPEFLGAGERGVLVPPGSAPALAAAIGSLIADEPRRADLRRRALAWAGTRTDEAQAGRVVRWMRASFPRLPWPSAETPS